MVRFFYLCINFFFEIKNFNQYKIINLTTETGIPALPISHEHKAIFVHIPKDAGESIEKTLGVYGGYSKGRLYGIASNRTVLQHLTAREIRSICGQQLWHNYFKFAVIRNPWSKAVSEYHWYLRYGKPISFVEWVSSLEERILTNKKQNILEVMHNIPQHKFVYHEGRLLVDRLLWLENINEGFELISKERKWNKNLQFSKATSSKNSYDFRKYYDSSLVSEVERIYQKDVIIFGYNSDNIFG